MKKINVSNIILAAEKAEKEKKDLYFELDRTEKTIKQCATDEGRAKWNAKKSRLLGEIYHYNTDFYNPLNDALATFEKPYRTRCFKDARFLLDTFQNVLAKINIPKKHFDGTTIYVKAFAGNFPAAYNGIPTTTEAEFYNKNGKWFLVGLYRVNVRTTAVTCDFSDSAKEAIVKRFTTF